MFTKTLALSNTLTTPMAWQPIMPNTKLKENQKHNLTSEKPIARIIPISVFSQNIRARRSPIPTAPMTRPNVTYILEKRYTIQHFAR